MNFYVFMSYEMSYLSFIFVPTVMYSRVGIYCAYVFVFVNNLSSSVFLCVLFIIFVCIFLM